MQYFTQILKASSLRNYLNVSTRKYKTNEKLKEKSKLKCINQVTLLGRAVNIAKKSDTEPVIVHFPMVTYDTHKYVTGEVYRVMSWHKVCIHDPLLQENVINTIQKGQRVYVSGTLGIGHVCLQEGLFKSDIVIDAEKVICIKTDLKKFAGELLSYEINLNEGRYSWKNDREDIEKEDNNNSEEQSWKYK